MFFKMKKLKSVLAILLSLSMAVLLLPQLALAASEDQYIKVTEEHIVGDVYKLVFAAKSPDGFNSFSIAFSYDHSVIVPIDKSTYNPVEIKDGQDNQSPLKMLDSAFQVLNTRWSIDTGIRRTAFVYNNLSFSGGTTSNDYYKLFEFYYKLENGKTSDDLNSATFRFEDGRDVGNNMLDKLNTSVGIVLNSNATIYTWGNEDPKANNIISDSHVDLVYTNSTKMPTPEEQETAKDPEDQDMAKEPDSSDTLPGDSTTQPPGDGTAAPPGDDSSQPQDDKTITTAGGSEIKVPGGTVVNNNGSVTLPNGPTGATITNKDGTTVAVEPGMTIDNIDEDRPLTEEDVRWINPFTDVRKSDWFFDDVMYVFTHGLTNGTTANTFSPQTSLTRAMLVTILYRNSGEPSVSGLTNPFSDVGDAYYTNPIIWAAANEIVFGYGNGKFGPGDNITRQDLAVILVRYAGHMGYELPELRGYENFNDEANISDYAIAAVRALYGAEVINGKDGNIFDPRGNATRAEIAAMLHRFLSGM